MRKLLMSKKVIVVMSLLLMTALIFSGCGKTAQFPNKEVTLIVPWDAGGSSDIVGRAMAKDAAKFLGKPMVVVNKPGANGLIAAVELIKTKPDGYTVQMGANGMFVTYPFVQEVKYKLEDFDILIGTTFEPIVLSVPADSPYQTLDDLMNAAKNNKDLVIKYGNSGLGGIPQLVGAHMLNSIGVKNTPIPFSGSAPALTAALGKQVDAAVSHPGDVIAQVKAGKMRALAISSSKRAAGLPDTPTMKEKGFDINMGVRKFIYAPKGLPADVRAKLIDSLKKIMEEPSFKKMLADMNIELEPLSGEETVATFQKEAAVMKELIAAQKK